MKLTKEIIRLFKYHGFVTVTVDDETILNEYKTVEEFTEAGYVNDPQAIKMAKMIFSDNGDPAVGPTTDDDVMQNAPSEVVELEPEPVVEPDEAEVNTATGTVVVDDTVGFATAVTEDGDVKQVVVNDSAESEPTPPAEPEPDPVEEPKSKAKKTTTKKKSTEKES